MKNLIIIILLLVVGFLAHDFIEENLTGGSESAGAYVNGTPVSIEPVAPTPANPVQPWAASETVPPTAYPMITSTGPLHDSLGEFCRLNPGNEYCP